MAALDASVRKGEKVAEKDVVQVTELLMNELLRLDAVVADGDVKAQRRMQVRSKDPSIRYLAFFPVEFQCRGRLNLNRFRRPSQVKRVQKYVETLDAVAARNAATVRKSGAKPAPPPPQQQQQQARQARWEMLDLLSSLPSTSSASSTTTVSSTASSGAPPTNRLDWMLF